MKLNKYRVKNCPAISFAGGCQNGEIKVWDCQDCTDCVMKQIVQECRKSIKCFESNEIACPVCNDAASAELAQDILQRLQIEEVE